MDFRNLVHTLVSCSRLSMYFLDSLCERGSLASGFLSCFSAGVFIVATLFQRDGLLVATFYSISETSDTIFFRAWGVDRLIDFRLEGIVGRLSNVYFIMYKTQNVQDVIVTVNRRMTNGHGALPGNTFLYKYLCSFIFL